MKRSLLIFIASAALAAACTKRSSLYCEHHPDDTANCSSTTDASTSCTTSAQCSAPLPACNTAEGECVECTTAEPEACTGTTPICEGTTCAACTEHSECISAVCLPDGSCADPATVAYVDPSGGDTDCTQAEPCRRFDRALGTDRPIIKVHGTIDEQVLIDDQNVNIIADRGAKLTYTGGNGILLRIDGESTVTISDLEITGATGATTGTGISLQNGNTADVTLRRVRVATNNSVGISAFGGKLTISESTIANNLGGGIYLSGSEFDITNTVIAVNGSPASTFGGVRFDQTSTGRRRFEFNTVTQNSATTSTPTGVFCTVINTAVTFSNNIVYDNQVGTGRVQAAGTNCNWTYSDIGPDPVAGTGNINQDPLFVNVGQNNFHLTSTSPVKDLAAASATLMNDIDGDPRPMGSGRDLGADEAP